MVGTVTYCRSGTEYAELAGPNEAEFRMLAVAPRCPRSGGRGRAGPGVRCPARDEGYAGMVLGSLAGMGSAHRLYARLGFVRDPVRDWTPVPHIALIAYAIRF
jgi:hypothetical protein